MKSSRGLRLVIAIGLVGAAAATIPVLEEVDEGDDGAAAGPTNPPRPPVVITRDDESLPEACRPRKVASLLQDFFAAYNRAKPTAMAFIEFGTAPGGGWYSVSETLGRSRRHFVARHHTDLARYFSRRQRQYEHLALRELLVSYANGFGHIEYRLRRRAEDRHRFGRRLYGKGAVDCERRKIVVWSMGNVEETLPSNERSPLCPEPERKIRRPVACARPTA